MAGARPRSRRLRLDKGRRPQCRHQHRGGTRRPGPRGQGRDRRRCRQRDPRLRQPRAGQASERVDFGLCPSRFAARQSRRHGQPRPSDRKGRQYRRVSEPQLHFELRRGKKAVDPRELLGPGANAGGNGKEPRAEITETGRVAPSQSSALGERVAIHLGPRGYDLDRLRAGQEPLNGIEDEELPPLVGKRVLHLQCHFGADSLKLLQRGAAKVVGVDFSAGHCRRPTPGARDGPRRTGALSSRPMLRCACRRSQAARIRSRFRDLGSDLLAARHPGVGQVVAAMLRPGGRCNSPTPIPPRMCSMTRDVRRTDAGFFAPYFSRDPVVHTRNATTSTPRPNSRIRPATPGFTRSAIR